jgi:hypothetical protein
MAKLLSWSFATLALSLTAFCTLSRTFDRLADRIAILVTAECGILQDFPMSYVRGSRLSFAAKLTPTAENRDAAIARLKKEIQRHTILVGRCSR